MRLLLTRRAFGVLLAAVALAASGCRRSDEGSFDVVVIGTQPRLVDPASAAPSPADQLLLANAAQGLVRFDAHGQVEPGLAERWNVSDDGLSYIFRLASTEWQGGGKITAEQVARLLRRHLAASSQNPLRDTLGVVDDVIAMTDRVLEIRLRAPRSNLLQILAQPEFALVRSGHGSGPFTPEANEAERGGLLLRRRIIGTDEEEVRREQVVLNGATAASAVNLFIGSPACSDWCRAGPVVRSTIPTSVACCHGRSTARRFSPCSTYPDCCRARPCWRAGWKAWPIR
jgi:oligopeptide transport system substrate-binding protein